MIILIAACSKSSTPASVPPINKDIDGNVYDTISIGSQLWMKENLKTTRYRNGDVIPEVTDPTAWVGLTTGAWCWYNNDSAAYASTYGKLYNWYAVHDPRGLAPTGWHVPSDVEWTSLSTGLGGDPVAGGKMKETGTTHWLTPNDGATNSSGFTGLPGGTRVDDGSFGSVVNYGYWWSSSEGSPADAWFRLLGYYDGYLYKSQFNKRFGMSVRCIRD
ncbi:fibrobacter succinogenes major paralogous domain-containing protein [Flavihumibacter profundi]|nr:fibrobacter succinogenes major paralogous domain-containing protein [Flavihumibacter profundi]MBZ5856947.1 fibrobacter succinogenes major paralogous domain-containing protein [Flavihumibacter profundi]